MISLTGIAESIATMYVNGLWKVALFLTLIGIALIVMSYARVWTNRQSDSKFESGVGIFTIGLAAHLLYIWSIGYLAVALVLIVSIITFSIYWFKIRHNEKSIEFQEDIQNEASYDNQCPRCGDTLIKRKNKKTGKSFMGCSSYPKCKFTATV